MLKLFLRKKLRPRIFIIKTLCYLAILHDLFYFINFFSLQLYIALHELFKFFNLVFNAVSLLYRNKFRFGVAISPLINSKFRFGLANIQQLIIIISFPRKKTPIVFIKILQNGQNYGKNHEKHGP